MTRFSWPARVMTNTVRTAQSAFVRTSKRGALPSVRRSLSRLPHGSRALRSCSCAGSGWDEHRFLVLRVDGCSEPDGPPIDLLHDVSETAPDSADAVEDNENGVRLARRRHEPDVPLLTSDAEPDRGAGYTELQDPDFVVLGTRRKVIRSRDRVAAPHRTHLSRTKTPSRIPGARSIRPGSEWLCPHYAPEVEEVER